MRRLQEPRRWLLRQQWFTSTLLPSLPRPVRWFLRRLYFLPLDLLDHLPGRREAMVPPRGTNFSGSVDDFRSSGLLLVRRLVDLAGLTPESAVLDIGAGWGRLAVGLTSFLDGAGRYEGVDIVPAAVDWSARNISSRYPRFRFTLADIYNKEYNPKGQINASEYRLPFADGSFDLVVLTSVFTHMLAAEVEHYADEIRRVLRVGGRTYITYNLVDDESLAAMNAGLSTLRLVHHSGPCWVVDPKVPELAVGYDSAYISTLYERHGLAGEYTVAYGAWSGRLLPGLPPDHGQDIVVSART